jgi:hypothetical protein
MKHDIASSLILARPPEEGKLRGLLPLEFNMHAAGIPACRQAGRQKNPLGYYIPPHSGQGCLKFMNYMG